MEKVATTDQIRHAIDSGKTGEKVAFPDPATAPLGTDAEAGGSPPTVAERALEQKSQVRARNVPAVDGRVAYALGVGVVAILALLIVFLALQ